MTVDEILKIIDKCKECCVSSFKMGDLHFKMNIYHVIPPGSQAEVKSPEGSFAPFQPISVPEKSLEELVKPLDPFANLTEEEIQYAATPYFDEIQAKKKLHQQKLNEGKLGDVNG